MSLPLATTKITIWRKDAEIEQGRDPWEDGYSDDPPASNDFAVINSEIRAVIKVNTGRQVGPGDSETVTFDLLADPCDLQYLDEVEDEYTGDRYQVEWAISNPGIGGQLASTRAGLTTRKGT